MLNSFVIVNEDGGINNNYVVNETNTDFIQRGIVIEPSQLYIGYHTLVIEAIYEEALGKITFEELNIIGELVMYSETTNKEVVGKLEWSNPQEVVDAEGFYPINFIPGSSNFKPYEILLSVPVIHGFNDTSQFNVEIVMNEEGNLKQDEKPSVSIEDLEKQVLLEENTDFNLSYDYVSYEGYLLLIITGIDEYKDIAQKQVLFKIVE